MFVRLVNLGRRARESARRPARDFARQRELMPSRDNELEARQGFSDV